MHDATPRRVIIDGAIWKLLDRITGLPGGFFFVQLDENPTVTRYFDLYLHQVAELDGEGVLETMGLFGEDPEDAADFTEDM